MDKTPASERIDYDEVTITSAGVPVVLSRYHSAPDRPVVLFLPGTMVHPLFYDSFLRHLAAAGYNVVGLHFLSHGKSPRIREDFTFDDLLENVRDAIGYCSTHYEGKLFMLGSSQGGILATAAADDERLCGVLAHDTILTELEETAQILNMPQWLYAMARPALAFVAVLGRLFPTYQVPLTRYLELERVTQNRVTIERFLNDPLCRKRYPLRYLASLFHADMHVATDGSIGCPFILIAARHERLFPFGYVQKVYEKLVAPYKELMVFDLPHHIIFIESEETVLGPVVEKLNALCRRL